MRKKAVVISTFVLVFALLFTACAARRPLQTPSQTGQDRFGMYGSNSRNLNGTGTTGVGTRTGVGTNYYTGNGPSSSDPYDLGYGAGNNAGYRYGGYNYGNTAGNPTYYGGYDNGLYGGYGVDYRNIGGSNNSPNYRYFNNSGMNGTNGTNGTNQSDNIRRSVEQMTGVNSASVVVSGNTAYVALNTNASANGQNITYGNVTGTTAIKQACAQRVRSANPQIRTVYVSTDANFAARLKAVENGVRAGSPVSSFFNELGDLVRGMTPQRQ